MTVLNFNYDFFQPTLYNAKYFTKSHAKKDKQVSCVSIKVLSLCPCCAWTTPL